MELEQSPYKIHLIKYYYIYLHIWLVGLMPIMELL